MRLDHPGLETRRPDKLMERTPDSAAHWQRYVPGGEIMSFDPGACSGSWG
jgi:hypothetical protein